MIIWILAGLAVWAAAWVVLIRPWLKCQEWAQGFFAIIEPVEIWLWNKSETILWARLNALGAVLLIVLPWAGAIDVDPWLAAIPQEHHWWIKLIPTAALMLNSLVSELLRRDTTKPLELVQVPEFKPVPVEVAAAVAQADAVKKEAVAVVREAKQEGKV